MLRRILIYLLTFSLAILGLAYIFAPPQIIEITEAQIAEGLADNLPYEVDNGVLVTVRSATAQLSDANKIIVSAQFEATGFTLEGSGTANVDSAIRYEKGRFYLSELKHDNVTFEFSENSDSTISDVRSTLEGILQRETEEATSSADQERIERLTGANEYFETTLREDAINLLDSVLGSFPVYDLNDADGRLKLAALALDDVEITSEKVRVTLSLQTLIKTVAGILGTFLLLVVLFLGPENTIRISMFLVRVLKGKSEDSDQ